MVDEAALNAAPENEVQTMKVLIVCEESWEEQNNDIRAPVTNRDRYEEAVEAWNRRVNDEV